MLSPLVCYANSPRSVTFEVRAVFVSIVAGLVVACPAYLMALTIEVAVTAG